MLLNKVGPMILKEIEDFPPEKREKIGAVVRHAIEAMPENMMFMDAMALVVILVRTVRAGFADPDMGIALMSTLIEDSGVDANLAANVFVSDSDCQCENCRARRSLSAGKSVN